MIEVELSDGRIVEFPDGTTKDEMREALARVPGAARPGSSLATPPGTTPDEAARIPPEMVFDPRTGGFVDTALAAQRMGSEQGANLSFLSGILGGGEFVDEGLGAVDAFFSDRSPEIATQTARESRSQFGEANPIQSTVLPIVGGITSALPAAAVGLPALAARAPSSLLGRLGLGSLLGGTGGAIEGAIQGAGAADEGDRGRGAQQGALVGGLGGAIFGGAAVPAAAGGRKVADFLIDQFGKGTRRVPGLSKEASDQVLLRLQADQAAGATRPISGDPGAMVVDASPSLQSLLDQSVNVSPAGAGVASVRVAERSAQAGRNLQTTFDEVMGGPEGIRTLSKTIRDDARPATRAAYTEAYSTPIDYAAPEGRAIESLLGRLPKKTTQSAIEAANDRMRFDGLGGQILAEIGDDGAVVFREMPNVIQLDYIKRAFSEIAEGGVDPLTGKISPDGAFARKVAREIRGTLGDAVPSYRTALSTASDGLSLQSATETGTRLLSPNVTREVISEWAEGATDVERRALASGLRSNIDERMANVSRAVTSGDIDAVEARKVLRDMSSRAARTKMETALGKESADQIFESLDRAQQALLVQAGIAKGSQTAGRLQGDTLLRESLATSPGQIARDIASGGVVSGPRQVLAAAAGNTPLNQAARQEGVQREIADYLTGLQGQEAAGAVEHLGGILQRQPGATQQAGQLGQEFGGTTGLLGYLLATQNQRGRGGPQ
jgi:hypothetical protein